MIYRYVSGIYQTGDFSALSYVKGYLDGDASLPEPKRILTVSGHGIGEAEIWLAQHYAKSQIDTISFRMVDTQLLQFLRAAERSDIERIFDLFRELIESYDVLSELAANRGLVPYWCEQSESITHSFERHQIQVYSDTPMDLPSARQYDLIYVSHGLRYLSTEAALELYQHVSPSGLLAILIPNRGKSPGSVPLTLRRFGDQNIVVRAKATMRQRFTERGYTLAPAGQPHPDLSLLDHHRELIRFNVLAPASAVLMGELILASLHEHISDTARLEILNGTASEFLDIDQPVYEELELYVVRKKPHEHKRDL